MNKNFSDELKRLIGPRLTANLRCLVRGKKLPFWGNLRNVKPLSDNFGFDRGTPVDRYYLHEFLEKNHDDICGDVLEIQSSSYTHRYGRRLGKVDSLDINPVHRPTYVCDLAQSTSIIPDESYNCFLLPNTLQHLRCLEKCLRQTLRIVKPGGVILASAAAFIPLIPDGPDYWRFSAAGWQAITQSVWPDCSVTVESHGNCLTAVAAMYGLALEELTKTEFDVCDPRFPVLITIRAVKPLKPIGNGGAR